MMVRIAYAYNYLHLTGLKRHSSIHSFILEIHLFGNLPLPFYEARMSDEINILYEIIFESDVKCK